MPKVVAWRVIVLFVASIDLACLSTAGAAAAPSASHPSAEASKTSSAGGSAALEALKRFGLVQVGTTFLLPLDAQLSESMKALRDSKSRTENYNRAKATAEREVRSAQAAVVAAKKDAAVWGQRLGAMNPKEINYNRTVDEANRSLKRVREAEKAESARVKDLNAFEPVKDDYVPTMFELYARMQACQASYTVLNANPKVQEALVATELKPAAKAGPSQRFTEELASMRNQCDRLKAQPVPFRDESNLAVVTVVLNGRVSRFMYFDSGAASVLLSAESARAAGLVPGPRDRTVSIKISSGKTVQAKQMTLNSVRLGAYEARNVECIVMPESVKNTLELLGGAFQRNFVVRIDRGASLIYLTPNKPATLPTETPAASPAAADPVGSSSTTRTASSSPPDEHPKSSDNVVRPDSGGRKGGLDRTAIVGRTLNNQKPFEIRAPDNSVLVGFKFMTGSGPGNAEIITQLTPVFGIVEAGSTTGQANEGKSAGNPTGGAAAERHTLLAKPGYAISSIMVRESYRIDGLRLTFARLQGGKLNPNDSYSTEWVVAGPERKDTHQMTMESGNRVILGIHGFATSYFTQFGLIVQE